METFKTIATRRSVRSYASEQITEEALMTILKAGGAAAMGMRSYNRLHMSVVQNKELLTRMNKNIGQMMVRFAPDKTNNDFTFGAPTMIIISCKDPENTPMKGMHYINSGCVVQNMMLAATELGLGSFVLGMASDAIKNDPQLQSDMNIPSDFTPLFGLALGYDAENKVIEKSMDLTIEVSRA